MSNPQDGTNPNGVGASPLRKEDARHLAGRALFVGDIPPGDVWEAAIVRSPVAHGYLHGVDTLEVPAGCHILTAADFRDIGAIRAIPRVPGFKASDFPIFATEKVRYVGQPVAICLAPTRAEAEDIVQTISIDIDELPAVTDTRDATTRTEPLIHESWGDNVYIEREVTGGDIEAAREAAEVTVTNEFRMNRHAAIPLECRAALAGWDSRRDELTLNMATQSQLICRQPVSVKLIWLPMMARSGLRPIKRPPAIRNAKRPVRMVGLTLMNISLSK